MNLLLKIPISCNTLNPSILKDFNYTTKSASYLDLHFEIDTRGRLNTKRYDKRDDFDFPIVNFPFLSGNIPEAPAYGVYISQLIRYSRACDIYNDFIVRARFLTVKILKQGYVASKLQSSLLKFYGRHHELIDSIFDVREEENGEILNESLSDSDSDKGLNYEDYGYDWESFSEPDGDNDCEHSDDEDGNDYESPSDEDNDSDFKAFTDMTKCQHADDAKTVIKTDETASTPIVIDLDNGITLHTTDNLRETLENFTTIKWGFSNDDDNFIKDLKFQQNFRFASEVYKLYLQSTPRKSKGHEVRTDVCNLSMTDKYNDKLVFKVPVFNDQLTGDHSIDNSLFEFKAYVETGGEWKTIDAVYEDGYVKFSCCCLNSFCILSKPRQIEQEIRPEGGTFRCGNNVIMHIPKESVKTSKTISYEVKQPEIFDIHREEEEWKPEIVVAVSDRIKMTNIKLSKPIVFSFPDLQDKSYPESSDKRLIGFEGNKPHMLDIQPKEIENRNFFKVKKYTGAALALVRHSAISTVTQHKLKRDIDVFYGDRKACYLLLLCKSKKDGIIHLMAEVILSDQLKRRHEQYSNQRLTIIKTSNMLFLLPLLRIRIVVSGRLSMVHRKGGSHYFLTFIHASKNNIVEFPVQTNAGGTPYAILEFKADNFDRKPLFETHFELHELSKSRSCSN